MTSQARPVLVLNGPNLGRLGTREPDVYGDVDAPTLAATVQGWAADLGLSAQVRQTDDEATLVSWLHEAIDTGADVILNPAAFTHYSYALRDAAAQVTTAGLRLVEVHLTNPAARERFRHTSVIAAVATGTIAGFGHRSYQLALACLTAS
ncbi:MAG: type II 3-dehydroquinate dehydratase [Beutenbergiaceae bacterium]